MIDSTAIREAIINAVVHNDYSYGATPKIEFFSDRVEITSMGGLPYGVKEDDFFGGLSVPRNKELMRIFRDLEIVEQLGSGVPRIIEAYGREAFEIRKSYFRVVMPYAKPFENKETVTEKMSEKGLVESQRKILSFIKKNPHISKKEMTEQIGISTTAIDKNITALKKKGLLNRISPAKGGHWEVVENNHE